MLCWREELTFYWREISSKQNKYDTVSQQVVSAMENNKAEKGKDCETLCVCEGRLLL